MPLVMKSAIALLTICFLCSLTATFDGYVPWTTDVHTYSVDDFLEVREFNILHCLNALPS